VANFDETLSKLKTLGSHLDARQRISLVAAFVTAVGLVGGMAWWISRPTYTLLFDDMDQAAAAEVVSKLDAQKVDYRIDPGGHGIRVPSNEVDRLRLDMSAQGLPSSGRIGFEIFDRTAFGQTEFLEHVNYRRALEGEIARTIATISEVSSARVHIAMAKDSLFGAREQPAKASVVLKLRHQTRPLSTATVLGVTNPFQPGRSATFFLEMLPYLFVVVVVIIGSREALRRRVGAPAALGIPYVRGERGA